MAEFWHSGHVPHVESRRSCREVSCYRPHTHDRLSIGLIDSGTSTFAGARDTSLRLAPGDVIVIPADQVHSCNPDDGRWTYQMIHIDQSWAASLVDDMGESRSFSLITVFRDPSLYQRLADLNSSLFDGRGSVAEMTAGFTHALAAAARATPWQQLPPALDALLAARLAAVLAKLAEDPENPRLDELAEIAGMSKFQLVRATRRATGLTPIAWRNNARVIRARAMLRDGRPVAEVAAVLGFADQSHFHRVFREHVAATPGAYRG